MDALALALALSLLQALKITHADINKMTAEAVYFLFIVKLFRTGTSFYNNWYKWNLLPSRPRRYPYVDRDNTHFPQAAPMDNYT